MKNTLRIIQIALIILLVADLFFWGLAHGSGHQIPPETNWAFGLTGLILLLPVIVISYFKRNR